MFRKLLFLFTLLSISQFAIGQTDLPAVVTAVEGKVKYSPRQKGCLKKLDTGTTLAEEGRVNLKNGARLRVYYDGRFHTFTDPGKQSVSALMPAQERGVAGGFASDFGNFLLAAAGGGTKDSGSDREKTGWGKKDFVAIMPFGGKVTDARTRFIWNEADGGLTYKVQIMAAGSDDPLLSRETTGGSLEINLEDAGLSRGRTYEWVVADASDANRQSARTSFTFASPAEKDQLLGKLKGMDNYQQGSDLEKGLMEAFLLERGEFFADANAHYLMLISQQPGNEIPKKAYRTFLNENGLSPLAKEVK